MAFEEDSHGVPRALAVWEYAPRAAGVYRFPIWTISTTWPAGIPRSWEVFRPAGHLSIVPEPFSSAAVGSEQSLSSSPSALVRATSGLPDGVRALSDREPRVRLAWRATLRHRVPMVATWEDTGAQVFLVPWPADNRPIREQAAMVYAMARSAIHLGRRFRITHPSVLLSPGTGEAHALVSIATVWKALEPPQDWVVSPPSARAPIVGAGVPS